MTISSKTSKPVKLQEIADAANVSLSTVSRVLNRRKYFEKISLSTIEKVRNVAREMNYCSHHAAQSLATNRSMVVGVYVHVDPVQDDTILDSAYVAEIISHIERFFCGEGYDILLVNLADTESPVERCVTKFHSRQIDGVLVIRNHVPKELQYLAESRIPAVAIDCSEPDIPLSYVAQDGQKGIELAVGHLAQLGHRNIAFLGACSVHVSAHFRDRHNGFIKRMRELGLSIRHDLHGSKATAIPRVRDHLFHEGIWAADYIASLPDRPTALVTSGDTQAFAALQRFGELGIRCPDQISVTGFDDTIWARWAQPSLTSVTHNLSKLACRCCEILLEQMKHWYNGETSSPIHERVVPGLVVRDSTGPLPG